MQRNCIAQVASVVRTQQMRSYIGTVSSVKFTWQSHFQDTYVYACKGTKNHSCGAWHFWCHQKHPVDTWGFCRLSIMTRSHCMLQIHADVQLYVIRSRILHHQHDVNDVSEAWFLEIDFWSSHCSPPTSKFVIQIYYGFGFKILIRIRIRVWIVTHLGDDQDLGVFRRRRIWEELLWAKSDVEMWDNLVCCHNEWFSAAQIAGMSFQRSKRRLSLSKFQCKSNFRIKSKFNFRPRLRTRSRLRI